MSDWKEYFEKAKDYLNKKKDDDNAIIWANKSLQLAKNEAELCHSYTVRAFAYGNKGNKTQAIDDLKIAADYNPTLAVDYLKKHFNINYTPQRRTISSTSPSSSSSAASSGGSPVATGRGKFAYAGGNYEGEWYNGVPHGKGKLIFSYGQIYDGDWVKGVSHGKGKLIYPSGASYVGDFSENKFHGIGKYTHSNGNVDEGRWSNGDFLGK